MSVKDQIRPAVEPALRALDLLVEDVAVTPAGKRRLVRIWIDRIVEESAADTTGPTEPLTLDEVADATRAVSDALDASDAMGEQPYTLEVTSPGLDRPLSEPRHFRRNVGRLVTITPVEGDPVTGRIVRAGAQGLTLDVPPATKVPATTADFAYGAVSKAAVEVEFSRPGPSEDDGHDVKDVDDARDARDARDAPADTTEEN